jgi:hypothetical protein
MARDAHVLPLELPVQVISPRETLEGVSWWRVMSTVQY